MKKIYIFAISLIAISFAGCYKTIDAPTSIGNGAILSYPAIEDYNSIASGLNYWNKALLEFDLGKAKDSILVSINLPKALDRTTTFELGINEEAYNAYKSDPIYKTQYTLMPNDYYELLNKSITIPAGKTDTAVTVYFYPSKIDISQTGYLLPLSITSSIGIETMNDLKTVFLHIEKDPFPPYSRAKWTVVDFSSEEPAEGQWGNGGQVIHLFDGKTSTFWHSKWDGGEAPLPHWFIIDMHATQPLNGMMFLDRQWANSKGRPKDVTIEVSKDNVNWEQAASLTLKNDIAWQKFMFKTPSKPVRYFKVTVNTLWNTAIYTNLAELKAL